VWAARVLNQNSRFLIPDLNPAPPGDNVLDLCCVLSFVTFQNINTEDNGMRKIVKNAFVSMSFPLEYTLHLQMCGA
jgi:hypothetical protein